jgi:hypothetical protein
MLRIEEPSSDFVRLLVRSVVLPEPHSTPSSLSTSPLLASSNDTPTLSDSNPDAEATEEREALQDPLLPYAYSSSSASAVQDTQAEVVAHQQAVAGGAALSPDAVASLLSPASGCEVLLQEESRWLVVSETFSPGDICR